MGTWILVVYDADVKVDIDSSNCLSSDSCIIIMHGVHSIDCYTNYGYIVDNLYQFGVIL